MTIAVKEDTVNNAPSQDLRPRISRRAFASILIGFLALILFVVGPVLSFLGLILGIVALAHINNQPDRRGGIRYAQLGILIGILGITLGWVISR